MSYEDYYESVRDFHVATDSPAPSHYTRLDSAAKERRGALIAEEIRELAEAFETNNEAGIIHECIDLLYVVFGTFVEMGINPVFGFQAIHEANMTKAGAPRNEYGKILKGANFVPAQMELIYNDLVTGGKKTP